MATASAGNKTLIFLAIVLALVFWGAVSRSERVVTPVIPESRMKIESVDSTVTGVTRDDLQNSSDGIYEKMRTMQNQITALESRVSVLEAGE